MKIFFSYPLVLFVTMIMTQLEATTTCTATVTFTILPIVTISVSGNPAAFVLTIPIQGKLTSTQMDNSTTYSVTSNVPNQRITGMIDTPMPQGVKMLVSLEAPCTGTTAGPIELTTTPQTLMSDLGTCSATDLTLTYTLKASYTAAPTSMMSRIVTYTIGP